MKGHLLLMYFPIYMEKIPADKRASAGERFGRALRIEFTGILVGALASDLF